MGKHLLVAAVLLCSLCAGASAAPVISTVTWQFSQGLKPSVKPKYADVSSVSIPADSKPSGRLRAVAVLENRSAKAVGGIVVRVAISARLVRVGSQEPGVWSLPFAIDERRVAELKAGASKSAPIPNIDLQNYLKRLSRTGFWVDALKIQLALEPRAGEELVDSGVSEAVLDIKH